MKKLMTIMLDTGLKKVAKVRENYCSPSLK